MFLQRLEPETRDTERRPLSRRNPIFRVRPPARRGFARIPEIGNSPIASSCPFRSIAQRAVAATGFRHEEPRRRQGRQGTLRALRLGGEIAPPTPFPMHGRAFMFLQRLEPEPRDSAPGSGDVFGFHGNMTGPRPVIAVFVGME